MYSQAQELRIHSQLAESVGRKDNRYEGADTCSIRAELERVLHNEKNTFAPPPLPSGSLQVLPFIVVFE